MGASAEISRSGHPAKRQVTRQARSAIRPDKVNDKRLRDVMKVKYLLLASFALPGAPALAQDAQAPTSQQIVVTGRGLDQTPATPAYDTQEIGREDIVSTASTCHGPRATSRALASCPDMPVVAPAKRSTRLSS